jgi:hypothetical protein
VTRGATASASRLGRGREDGSVPTAVATPPVVTYTASKDSMRALSRALLLRDAYRDEACGGPNGARIEAHLADATEALNMALLTLSGPNGEDRGDKWGRAQQARGFLAEAVTALSRARIYHPSIRTLSQPVLWAAAPTPDAELCRLHQIATRLLWQNHVVLPARSQGSPLPPEEEAALADVVRGLDRHAKIGRALRHRYSIVALTLVASGPVWAVPFSHVLLLAAIVVCVGWLVRRQTSAPATAALPPAPADALMLSRG